MKFACFVDFFTGSLKDGWYMKTYLKKSKYYLLNYKKNK